MSPTRREAMLAACALPLCAAAPMVTGASCAEAVAHGRTLQARLGSGTSEFELLSGSGDAGLDGQLQVLAYDIVRAIDLPPGAWPSLLFFDEGATAPNCFQVDDPAPKRPIVPNTRGAVVIGRRLSRALLGSPKLQYLPGAALAGVVAHEFAHAHQRTSGAFDRLFDDDPVHFGQTPYRLIELHADFLAGFYMGRQSGFSEQAALDFTTAIASLGDSDFANPTHHGTPAERAFCMYRGRNLAGIVATTFEAASVDGERFVRALHEMSL